MNPVKGNKMLLDLDDILNPDRRTVPRTLRIASPADLPSEWFVAWDERAAIMEYEGSLPREIAEHESLLWIVKEMKNSGCRVIAPPYISAA
jgi:hypothetical protein